MPGETVARTKTCVDCGGKYTYRTNPGVRCPPCRKTEQRKVQRAWKERNREKVRAWYHQARAADPNGVAARFHANYMGRRERALEQNREWRKANPEKRRVIAAKYYANHREELAIKRRAYRDANREKRRLQNKRWKAANPEKVRAHQQKRYALKRGATIGLRFTNLEIAERDGWRCHLCGGKVTRKDWSIDHLVPLSKGGEHSRQNVALAHKLCNIKRGNRGDAQLRLLG